MCIGRLLSKPDEWEALENVCLPVYLIYTASERLYSIQSAVNDLMNVSDYVVMDTQELSIIGASALECNSAKWGSFKQGNTVLCCQISVWSKKWLGWQFGKVEATVLT